MKLFNPPAPLILHSTSADFWYPSSQALSCVCALIGAFVPIVFANPLSTPVVLVVGVAFVLVVRKYRPIAADSRRLISVLHGPIVSHVLDSLHGREYVRSFGQVSTTCLLVKPDEFDFAKALQSIEAYRASQVDYFLQHALVLLEASTQAQYFNIALQRWLAMQLELLGGATLLCVSLLSVYMRDRVPLGLSGLALTYALTLTALAKYLVNYATRAE